MELTHVTTRVAAHFPMPPPPPPSPPPPPPCHGGTAGTGDTGDTSAKPPPTRTIAWHTVPSPPPPPPCHGGTRDIGDTREVHKHNKAQARLHETQNEFMQFATR